MSLPGCAGAAGSFLVKSKNYVHLKIWPKILEVINLKMFFDTFSPIADYIRGNKRQTAYPSVKTFDSFLAKKSPDSG